MTDPAHAGRMLFVNMPVADVERSKAFFAKLGFSYNPMLTDETAACMLVGEHAFVMLLSRERFAEFAKLPIADPTTHTLALYCSSVSSRDGLMSTITLLISSPGSSCRALVPPGGGEGHIDGGRPTAGSHSDRAD
jgi:predicted lactoylglutathione lyase